MSNAKIPDLDTFIKAGFDSKTGLPLRFGSFCSLKDDIKKTLRILDEQNAIRRYCWYNLPSGLNTELIERVLYYNGQGMFFYNEITDKFMFLPYALNGTIDYYGRFLSVVPVPFNGSINNDKGKATPLQIFNRKPIYDLEDAFINEKAPFENCILIHDYAKQISQTNIPRSVLQEPILNAMAEGFPFARTALIANSGIKGIEVQSENESSNVKAASRAITQAALSGDPWIPIVGQTPMQDLTSSGSALKSEEYLLYMQALDNFRLSLYGLDNGGLFQKRSHMLEAEQEMNSGKVKSALEDGLILRQEACDCINAVFGLGVWVEVAEAAAGIDENLDGKQSNELDQSGTIPGDQPNGMEVANE